MSNPLSEHEIESKLTDLNDWRFEQNFIRKSFRFTTFRDAMSFLVRVSFEAEQLDHHPIYDLLYVIFLASQVRIFNLVEERDQGVGVCF